MAVQIKSSLSYIVCVFPLATFPPPPPSSHRRPSDRYWIECLHTYTSCRYHHQDSNINSPTFFVIGHGPDDSAHITPTLKKSRAPGWCRFTPSRLEDRKPWMPAISVRIIRTRLPHGRLRGFCSYLPVPDLLASLAYSSRCDKGMLHSRDLTGLGILRVCVDN